MQRPVPQPPKRRKRPPRSDEPALPPSMAEPIPDGELTRPEVYYSGPAKDFWVRTPQGGFTQYNEGGLRLMLALDHGHSPPQCDNFINDVRGNHAIEWTGALAGYWSGFYVVNGHRVLVINSPTIIPANPNWDEDNSLVYDYFERLLGEEQAIHFHIWMKLAREALLNKSLRRGPCMIIVGKADLGKTFGAKLIKRMLGGRVADPAGFAQGQTIFNSELFGNEFLLADDKGGTNYQARQRTATVIKQLVADETPCCHGKHQKAISLDVFWRVMYALNDEPDDLDALPALSDSIMDKLLIFKAVGRAVKASTVDGGQYTAFAEQMYAAIPDYLGWLETFEIPEEYHHWRFGQVPYANPEVLRDLRAAQPPAKLLQCIDQCGEELFGKKLEARDYESTVTAYNEKEARDLFRRPGNCGHYLARLCHEEPTRVFDVGRLHGGSRRYLVKSPEESSISPENSSKRV